MDQLVALIAFSFVSAGTPGPNNILLWASGAEFGFRPTVPHIIGTALGIGAMALAVAAGIGALITTVPQLELAMKAVGSIYLLYLAYQVAGAGALERRAVARPLGLIQAVAFQVINPKAWFFALGAMTTFRPTDLPVVIGSILVATTMLLVVIPSAALWAGGGDLLSRYLEGQRTRPDRRLRPGSVARRDGRLRLDLTAWSEGSMSQVIGTSSSVAYGPAHGGTARPALSAAGPDRHRRGRRAAPGCGPRLASRLASRARPASRRDGRRHRGHRRRSRPTYLVPRLATLPADRACRAGACARGDPPSAVVSSAAPSRSLETASPTPARPTPSIAPPPSLSPILRTYRGEFVGEDEFHFARGTARVVETAPGAFTLRLEDFSVRNGPDLYVYLSADPTGYADGAIELGSLKATDGSFNYEVPPGVEVDAFGSVVIWCRAFSVQFGVAELAA